VTANPFGDKDQGSGASKRPAQTIEGTATEMSVEPGPEEELAGASGPEEGGRGEGLNDSGSAGRDDPPSPPPPRRRLAQLKSFLTHLAAGLVGGLIGVIALALSWSGFGPGQKSAPAPEIAAIEQRLAKLEAAPLSAPDTQALSALEGRIAALEASQEANAPKLSELADRIAKLDTSLEALAKTAEEGGSVPAAAAIGQQIEEAEQRLDTKVADALAKGEAANTAAIEEIAKGLAELRAKLGALAEAEFGTGDASAAQPELAALAERLAKLEAMLPELAGAIDKEAAGAKSAALAIAFANLRAAVSDGRPYAAELDTMGTLAPALGDLGVLPAYAEKGIPTLLDLTRSFAAARDEALAAPAPEGDASLVGSLVASAQSMVKVRRIDEAPAGEGAEAALARAKSALDNDNLAAAVKEVETLDGKARDAFSAWLGEARARLAAGETLTRLEGALLISMSGEAEATQP
jgi:hypothetical protein